MVVIGGGTELGPSGGRVIHFGMGGGGVGVAGVGSGVGVGVGGVGFAAFFVFDACSDALRSLLSCILL